MDTWRRHLHDFEIKRWDETNSPIDDVPYMRTAHQQKRWAFVADYMRFFVLEKFGGIYLDTDMEVVRDLTPLLNLPAFMGYESATFVAQGIIGAVPQHAFIQQCLSVLDHMGEQCPQRVEAIPRIVSRIIKEQGAADMVLFPTNYFYPYNPFDPETRRNVLLSCDISEDTYAIHHWDASWTKPRSWWDVVMKTVQSGKRLAATYRSVAKDSRGVMSK